jgi:hypothetical protein
MKIVKIDYSLANTKRQMIEEIFWPSKVLKSIIEYKKDIFEWKVKNPTISFLKSCSILGYY